MQEHEHFEELCALVPIGQLTGSEYQELVEHLKGCAACRHATEDFALVLDQLPLVDTHVDDRALLSLQGDSYRERFLKRAVSEGVPFSTEMLRPENRTSLRSKPRRQRIYAFAFAMAAVVCACFAVLYQNWLHMSARHEPAVVHVSPALSPSPDHEKDNLIARLQSSVDTLQQQIERQKQVISGLQVRTRISESDSANLSVQLAEANEERLRLQAQLAAASNAVAAAKSELASVQSAKEEEDAALVEQQFKLAQLSEQLKNEGEAAERDRQLSRAVSDVRDLMGARNLHIIDVSDVDGDGKAKKAFGRVFLTEGKSLIFYAFDLGHKGNAAKVSFQAWGQWDTKDKGAKNLGVFRIDDTEQRRWVLKVEDPEKLKDINTLFVTVEPLGGTARPTGKKLLYAYFGVQPNHP